MRQKVWELAWPQSWNMITSLVQALRRAQNGSENVPLCYDPMKFVTSYRFLMLQMLSRDSTEAEANQQDYLGYFSFARINYHTTFSSIKSALIEM